MNAPLPSQHHTIPAALAFIQASDRETWVRMAMAIKSELGEAGFVIWDRWSQSADSYAAKDSRAVWKSVKAGGKVTIGFENRNGYELAQFKDAFSRYLASSTQISSTTLQANTGAAFGHIDNSMGISRKTLSSTRKPNTGAGCRVVEDKKPDFEGSEANEAETADWLADYESAELSNQEVF